MTRIFIFFFVLFSACGAAKTPEPSVRSAFHAAKMQHQILFSRPSEDHVFEGYMILAEDALLVKAFAGPGVDLFTVIRDGASHFEELHISALADRIDIAAVSADIARVYLGGCEKPPTADEASCDFFGEKMTEVFDEDGRLKVRRFPEAHGIGVTVTYEEYELYSGRAEARRITLVWGTSPNRMVIRLVAFELLDEVNWKIFERP
ncbi:MAG: hypothetical protein GY854_25460 [Deltaproteobacteria bacterium]|nr:hypothetical protein [Deltaproteobacteria bacterium]